MKKLATITLAAALLLPITPAIASGPTECMIAGTCDPYDPTKPATPTCDAIPTPVECRDDDIPRRQPVEPANQSTPKGTTGHAYQGTPSSDETYQQDGSVETPAPTPDPANVESPEDIARYHQQHDQDAFLAMINDLLYGRPW